MQRLFINGNGTDLFFSNDVTLEEIGLWMEESIMFNDKNIFGLNEQHSCDIIIEDGVIIISGDEDFKDVIMKDVVSIL